MGFDDEDDHEATVGEATRNAIKKAVLRRREYLAGLSAFGATSIAGCSAAADQRFEASPIGLPAADQEGLLLGETLNDFYTVSRKGPSGNVEVTVSSHVAGYSRAAGVREYGTVRTALGHYLGRVNGVDGAVTSASLVPGTNVAPGSKPLSVFSEDVSIDAESVAIVAPEGLRRGAEGEPISAFNAGDLELDAVTLGDLGGVTAFELPGKRFWPGSMWIPKDSFFPGSMWWPGSMWIAETGWHPGKTWIPSNPDYGTTAEPADDADDARCLVFVSGERSFEETFGVAPGEVEAQVVEPGQRLEASKLTVASVGTALFDWEFESGYEALFTEGRPAALGGAVFDFGVLATPSASVAGVEANPLVGMDSKALLEREQTRDLLRDAGVSDADRVEWLSGPERVPVEGYLALNEKLRENVPEGMADMRPTVLGDSTEIESFAGVVSGRHGPWTVGVHLARATPDDHVIAIGVQRTPLGSTGALEADAEPPTPFPIISWVNWYRDARAMMQVTVSQLTTIDS